MANLRTLGEACHNLRIICVFLVPFITFFGDTTCHYCNDSLRKRRDYPQAIFYYPVVIFYLLPDIFHYLLRKFLLQSF